MSQFFNLDPMSQLRKKNEVQKKREEIERKNAAMNPPVQTMSIGDTYTKAFEGVSVQGTTGQQPAFYDKVPGARPISPPQGTTGQQPVTPQLSQPSMGVQVPFGANPVPVQQPSPRIMSDQLQPVKLQIPPDETINTQYGPSEYKDVCIPQAPYLCGKDTIWGERAKDKGKCRKSEEDCNMLQDKMKYPGRPGVYQQENLED